MFYVYIHVCFRLWLLQAFEWLLVSRRPSLLRARRNFPKDFIKKTDRDSFRKLSPCFRKLRKFGPLTAASLKSAEGNVIHAQGKGLTYTYKTFPVNIIHVRLSVSKVETSTKTHIKESVNKRPRETPQTAQKKLISILHTFDFFIVIELFVLYKHHRIE